VIKQLADPNYSVVYQIYPATFQDSDGDGFGDLRGITSRLDYLAALGVDYIWISPFFPSPQADAGYDVSDYCDVDPRYGTLADFREMTAEARKRGIGVVIDLVMNHTSIEHPWFVEARRSKDNPKRNYFTWSEDRPNNWKSVFGGSAWNVDRTTHMYYLHTFLPQQPDLNWENPAVRREFTGKGGVLEFWAGLGVSGFRCDAIKHIAKNPSLADDQERWFHNPELHPRAKLPEINSRNWKNLMPYINSVADKAASLGCFLLLEAYPEWHGGIKEYTKYYHEGRPNCRPMMIDLSNGHWNAHRYREAIDNYQSLLRPGDVPSYAFGNHDNNRIATRAGTRSAKAAMTLLLTLPGQPVIYNGDELGMEDGKVLAKQIRDPIGKRLGDPKRSRDPERTPMQWSGARNAGFSSAKKKDLWLPVGKKYKRGIHAVAEAADHHSVLNHTRQLIKLRNGHSVLREGTYRSYDTGHPDVFGFERVLGDQVVLVLINFGKRKLSIGHADGAGVLSSTEKVVDKDWLAPYEARVLQRY